MDKHVKTMIILSWNNMHIACGDSIVNGSFVGHRKLLILSIKLLTVLVIQFTWSVFAFDRGYFYQLVKIHFSLFLVKLVSSLSIGKYTVPYPEPFHIQTLSLIDRAYL